MIIKLNCKKILAVICIMLILCYPFSALLPHVHDCINGSCLVCHLTDIAKIIFTALAVGLAFLKPFEQLFIKAGFGNRYIDQNNNTLVLQKVKLSD